MRSCMYGLFTDIRCLSIYGVLTAIRYGHDYKVSSRIDAVFMDKLCFTYIRSGHGYSAWSWTYCVYGYTFCSRIYGVVTGIRCCHVYILCSLKYGVVSHIQCCQGHSV